jgi:ABC-type glycerol-3-phosphate transport system substrate-binding protein
MRKTIIAIAFAATALVAAACGNNGSSSGTGATAAPLESAPIVSPSAGSGGASPSDLLSPSASPASS